MGWTRATDAAHMVHLHFGDGSAGYANPQIRHAIANALDFVTQAEPAKERA